MKWKRVKVVTVSLTLVLIALFTFINHASYVPVLKAEPVGLITGSGTNNTFYRNVSVNTSVGKISYLVEFSTPNLVYPVGVEAGGIVNVFLTSDRTSFPVTGISVNAKLINATNTSAFASKVEYPLNNSDQMQISYVMMHLGSHPVSITFRISPVVLVGFYEFVLPGKEVSFTFNLTGING